MSQHEEEQKNDEVSSDQEEESTAIQQLQRAVLYQAQLIDILASDIIEARRVTENHGRALSVLISGVRSLIDRDMLTQDDLQEYLSAAYETGTQVLGIVWEDDHESEGQSAKNEAEATSDVAESDQDEPQPELPIHIKPVSAEDRYESEGIRVWDGTTKNQ